MSQRASQREEIERSLGGYQASAVAVIAAEHGIERSRFSRKNDQIEELARRLASGAGLRELLSKLTPPQIEALAFVARKGGQAALRSVTTLLSRQSGSQEQADKLVHELLLRGLLLFAGGGNSWRLDLSGHDPTLHMRLVWIPRSVAELLPGDGGWAPLVEPASEPAETRAGDPGDLLRDVYLALRSLRARPMRLTQQGEPHQSDLRRVVTEMRPHIDPKNWRDAAGDIMIAVALATSASLLDLGDAGFAPSPAADEFLVATRPAQVARLYAAWRELDWNELERVPTLQVDGYAGGYGDVPDAARLAAARGLIDAVLRELADREWWSVGSLSAAIRRRDPDFLVGGATSVALLIGSWGYWSPYTAQQSEEYRGIRRAGVTDYRKSALSRETDWDEVEGAYLRQTLLDPLRWLGIVDVGLDGRGRVVAARVTPLGQSVLTGASAPPAPARVGGARLVVQPNFEVIVLDATASLDLMARLDGFATARSVDRAAIYHLTREGLVAALQGGARLAEIERLLEEESGGPLPQNVRYSLTEWARQFERVTVRRAATMLEADDAAQLDRWLAEPALGRLLGERLGPTVALVPAANVAAVVERLRRHDGWREENAAGPLPGALRLRGDQALHLKAEAAGRFERHRLAGFADEVDADRAGRLYRVTANSAARARDQGWTAAKVLALLHNRLGVEPPADLTLKLRGWLGDFGAAQQATMRLVRLPDPSLWRVVEPAAAGGVVARVGPAMAVVDEAALALIAEALAAHGVRLEATTPATAAGPLLGARRDEAAPLAGHDLQTLRGKPLREFLQSAATNKRDVTLMHQGANQRSPKRHTVTPRYVDHRMNGYYLVATTEAGTDRAFKLDDIFGVALEEGQ